MIHLVNGCSGICSLPGKCATECGKICGSDVCKPCENFTKECGIACSDFCHRPLGPYVVIGVLLSAVEVATCCKALLNEDLEKCQLQGSGVDVGIQNWLYGQCGTAFINLIFAPYIQYQLWRNLQQEAAEESLTSGAQPGVETRFVDVPKAKVQEAFWNVFLYDLGVCAYVFVLFGSAAWSYMGSTWIEGIPACNPDGVVSLAATLGSGVFAFVLFYFVCYVCYIQCMNTMEVTPGGQYMRPLAAAALREAAPIPGMRQHPVPGVPAAGGAAAAAGGSGGLAANLAGRAAAGAAGAAANAAASRMTGGVLGGIFNKQPKNNAAATQAAAANTAATPFAPSAPFAAPEVNLPPKKRTPMERAMTPSQMMKLLACIGLDLCGDASYFIPGLGEGIDIAYAPAQGIALKMLYSYNTVAVVGFVEEILPGMTDILPTATIGWLLEVFAPDNMCTRAIGIRHDGNM